MLVPALRSSVCIRTVHLASGSRLGEFVGSAQISNIGVLEHEA
jgi:hypothetical protein